MGKELNKQHFRWRSLLFVFVDLVIMTLSYGLAIWVRFDFQYSHIDSHYIQSFLKILPFYLALGIVVFYFCKLYSSIWTYASYSELIRVVIASVGTCVIYILLSVVLSAGLPISCYAVGALIQFAFLSVSRFSIRLFTILSLKSRKDKETADRVMMIGAGQAAQMLLRDIQVSREINDRVVCIIDDDPKKQGLSIDGVPIVGTRDDILLTVERYKINKIYVAIPSASAEQKRDILNICKETGCKLSNLPGMYQLALGEVTVNAMKEVDIVDLLGRDPIKVNMDEIFSFISGKVILVTGGGGSIGSELCRQVAAHNPKQLIIFDIYENNAYAIQLELKDKYPNLNLEVLIGSVRDSERINQVFSKYKPDIVYHAAAHKHVPLMEDSPNEAIKNNTIGTYKTAYAAMANGCKRFVLISTDKAVNPTNIMGASKRLCEMVIQTFAQKIKEGKAYELPKLHVHEHDEDGSMSDMPSLPEKPTTEFVAVRFGNVLGSNGSVVPRFKEQIEKGGPVTVTHPDIIRYFMTIPEAVSLVLQAGVYAKGGEIFVLDMGTPMKIDTLARNLIKLSGFTPDVDIKIEYTGLRPGEKLFEEKLMAEEGLKTTANKLIFIGCPIHFDSNEFIQKLQQLMLVAYNNNDDIKHSVANIVTTYKCC